MSAFYNQLAPYYHLIFPDWDQSIKRQAVALDQIIKQFSKESDLTLLDAACGIGTQSIGLQQLGYQVHASDLSEKAVERARFEARKRALEIAFAVCDMRKLFEQWRQEFDVVIACDNSIPHLLSDGAIKEAFYQMYLRTKAGGSTLISVRDYESEPPVDGEIKHYGTKEVEGIRYVLFQVWKVEGPVYEMSFYVVEDVGESNCKTEVMRTKYYAIGKQKLKKLMQLSGFENVHIIEDAYYQPILVGHKSE